MYQTSRGNTATTFTYLHFLFVTSWATHFKVTLLKTVIQWPTTFHKHCNSNNIQVGKFSSQKKLCVCWRFESQRCPCNFNFFMLLLQFSIYYDLPSSVGSSLIKRKIEKMRIIATLPSLLKFVFYPPASLTNQGAQRRIQGRSWGSCNPPIENFFLLFCLFFVK